LLLKLGKHLFKLLYELGIEGDKLRRCTPAGNGRDGLGDRKLRREHCNKERTADSKGGDEG
jgi:hypothetical protein